MTTHGRRARRRAEAALAEPEREVERPLTISVGPGYAANAGPEVPPMSARRAGRARLESEPAGQDARSPWRPDSAAGTTTG